MTKPAHSEDIGLPHIQDRGLTMTVAREGALVDMDYNDVSENIKKGDVVGYLGHILGGNVHAYPLNAQRY